MKNLKTWLSVATCCFMTQVSAQPATHMNVDVKTNPNTQTYPSSVNQSQKVDSVSKTQTRGVDQSVTRTQSARDNRVGVEKTVTQMKVIDIIRSEPSLSSAARFLEKVEPPAELKSGGPFTVFVPNNEGFKDFSQEDMNDILKPENRQDLYDMLKDYVVSGVFDINDLTKGDIKTLNGNELDVDVDSHGVITINDDAQVVKQIKGPNGVVYIIDSVFDD